ncbi:MAG: 16S rRNA (cytidine(1402)-2'-O)-methyltransferase [Candidatus Omnitrophica bacterium]|nr:16S rRNA (cytidine(1402)-2'-O)-methyltransferase [Candidatus Omnitrophota bacterium]
MLYVVSTPIGNLKDITLRAVDILSKADFIACEDTRHTNKLLAHYNIKKPLISYHSYNKQKSSEEILKKLKAGSCIALVTDSGTPGVNDPGWLIIKKVIDAGLPLEAIPGVSAFLAALSISGMPTDKFFFAGFLSSKSGRRRGQIENLAKVEATIIIYEAPHRIIKLLKDLLDCLGDADIVLARELTKKFEEVRREKISTSLRHFSEVRPRGEFVVIFRPSN